MVDGRYRCENGHLKPMGCFADDRSRLDIDGTFQTRGYVLQCVLDASGDLSFRWVPFGRARAACRAALAPRCRYKACLSEQKQQFGPSESWQDDRYWYVCTVHGEYLRPEVGGCVHEGKRYGVSVPVPAPARFGAPCLQVAAVVEKAGFLYECKRNVNNSSSLCPVACVHQGRRYNIEETFEMGQYWYTCTLHQGRIAKVCVGCLHKEKRLKDGDRWAPSFPAGPRAGWPRRLSATSSGTACSSARCATTRRPSTGWSAAGTSRTARWSSGAWAACGTWASSPPSTGCSACRSRDATPWKRCTGHPSKPTLFGSAWKHVLSGAQLLLQELRVAARLLQNHRRRGGDVQGQRRGSHNWKIRRLPRPATIAGGRPEHVRGRPLTATGINCVDTALLVCAFIPLQALIYFMLATSYDCDESRNTLYFVDLGVNVLFSSYKFSENYCLDEKIRVTQYYFKRKCTSSHIPRIEHFISDFLNF